MHDRALTDRFLLSFTTKSRYFILFSKNASGTTQFHHTSDQNTLKDITNLFQREQLLSNHAAVFLGNGEDPNLYPKLYPVGYSFGACLRLYWFVEGTMSRFSMKQSDYPNEIPGEV